MNRIQIMEEAIRLTKGDRQEEYGSFLRNMETWAALLTTYLIEKYRGQEIDENSFRLSAEDAAQFMVLNKIMRTMQAEAKPKADTFVDEACYAAMAGEAAFAAVYEETPMTELLKAMAETPQPTGVEVKSDVWDTSMPYPDEPA